MTLEMKKFEINEAGIKASDIANFLKKDLIGHDIYIESASSLSSPKDKSLVFAKNLFHLDDDAQILILCTPKIFANIEEKKSASFILCANPRLAFAKVVAEFFTRKESPIIHETAIISDEAIVHSSVSIGANCVVHSGVVIGEGTIIKNNVTIAEKVQIGNFCLIKSGAVIGEEGFGFELDDNKTPVKLPHIGSVTIGNHVEIGANVVVARGTLNNTVIFDYVKIDDLAFIAHNVIIKSKTLVIACAQISGSVEIDESVWIGPNSSIIQKTKIGRNATIGIGTVVTSDVNSDEKVMGISGFSLRLLIKFKKFLKSL